MSRIPKHFIDDLLSRTDIVNVIDTRVPLKKAGANYVACCPFHNEKTPSFTVSPTKQFYHCFGCGAHGTALGFLMEFERIEFPEAVETLAQSLGIEVPRETGAAGSPKPHEKIYQLLQQSAEYYRRQLKISKPAIEYLKNRGLSGKTAADYGIGYAPPGWDKLLNSYPQAQHQTLLRAGLIIEKGGNSHYDRFRDRIMFPIRDQRGRTIGFGGRVLSSKDTPKYLNSPETPVFHKGRALYGIHEIRQLRPQPKTLLVVEGYMDVVMLAEHNIRNSVATLGTATTAEHIQTLFRLSDDIVFCFDGDEAGRRAAWRALETALPLLDDRHQIRFLFLPEGQDPDSLVNAKGREAFLNEVNSAQPLSGYLMNHLQQQCDLNSLDGKAQLAEIAKPVLQRMRDGVLKNLIIESLASTVGLSADKLALPATPPEANKNRQPTTLQQKPGAKKDTLMRHTISALLTQPDIAQNTQISAETLKRLDRPGIDLLIELVNMINANPGISTQALLQRFDQTEHAVALTKLAIHEIPNPDNDSQLLQKIFDSALQKLQSESDAQQYEALLAKSPDTLTDEEREALKNFRQT